jgi:MYXO-CTERM domain-containing protein
MIRTFAAQHGFPVGVVVAVAAAMMALPACGGDPAAEQPEPAGALTGELTVHIFNLGDRSEVLHTLRLGEGDHRELRFDAPPELTSGVRLRVFGADDGRVVQVSRFEELEGPPIQQALIDGTQKPSKRWAFVLVDTGAGVNLSKETAMDRLFSDAPTSIRSYYREVSYGLQELSGDVLGPFTITPPAGGLCQNFVSVVQTLLPMLSGSYNQYLWYFGSRISGCPWAGVAQLGTAAGPTRHSFYNASSECAVLVQEPGHNFGMVHSSSLKCQRGGAAASMIAGAEDGECTHSEYGNPFDPMGGGGGSGSQQMLNRCYHMNGVQKAYQDWLGGCNIVKATTSGRFTIYPLEKACNGVQVLQVPLVEARALRFPASPAATLTSGLITSYYVELRAPVGLDSGLQTPRVFIVAAGNLREARTQGNPNWLIDTTPETASVSDAALGVGKTFSDPAPGGPRITLISADATRAVVQVQLGATGGGSLEAPGVGACSDDTSFTAPGPDECAGGSNATPADAGPAGVPDAGPDATTGFVPSNPFGGGSPPATPGGSAEALQGGCGCRLTYPGAAPAAPALLLALLALLGARRRRR